MTVLVPRDFPQRGAVRRLVARPPPLLGRENGAELAEDGVRRSGAAGGCSSCTIKLAAAAGRGTQDAVAPFLRLAEVVASKLVGLGVAESSVLHLRDEQSTARS